MFFTMLFPAVAVVWRGGCFGPLRRCGVPVRRVLCPGAVVRGTGAAGCGAQVQRVALDRCSWLRCTGAAGALSGAAGCFVRARWFGVPVRLVAVDRPVLLCSRQVSCFGVPTRLARCTGAAGCGGPAQRIKPLRRRHFYKDNIFFLTVGRYHLITVFWTILDCLVCVGLARLWRIASDWPVLPQQYPDSVLQAI